MAELREEKRLCDAQTRVLDAIRELDKVNAHYGRSFADVAPQEMPRYLRQVVVLADEWARLRAHYELLVLLAIAVTGSQEPSPRDLEDALRKSQWVTSRMAVLSRGER